MAEHVNNYGRIYIRCTDKEINDAIKRWGSRGMAASKLGMTYEAVRERTKNGDYKKYYRHTPVITNEFNEYVMRAW